MPYVIKAVSTSGIVTWLTAPGVGGCRAMAPRSSADVLSTPESAWRVIAEMPWVFTDAGIRFSVVETSDADGTEHVRDSTEATGSPKPSRRASRS